MTPVRAVAESGVSPFRRFVWREEDSVCLTSYNYTTPNITFQRMPKRSAFWRR